MDHAAMAMVSLVFLIPQVSGDYRIMTAGYSNLSYSYSFTNGHLDELLIVGIEDNMTFLTFDAATSMLYAVHEAYNYSEFEDIGAVSRDRYCKTCRCYC